MRYCVAYFSADLRLTSAQELQGGKTAYERLIVDPLSALQRQ